jgi:hypothetical protein
LDVASLLAANVSGVHLFFTAEWRQFKAWLGGALLMAMIVACVLALAAAGPGELERVRVADAGKGFVLAASGKPFTP